MVTRPLSHRRVRNPTHLDFSWNRIIVIESLPPGELKTGTRLFEDVIYPRIGGAACLFRVASPPDFLTLLDALRDDSAGSGAQPILHIEAHGDRLGLKLARGPVVPWGDLVERLRAINIAARNNLLVVMSTCYGIHVLEVFAQSPLLAAPVRAAFGPEKEVRAGDIEDAFKRFYTAILEKRDPSEAARQLRGDLPAVKFMAAEQIFAQGFQNYLSKHCTRQVLDARVDRIVTAMRVANPHVSLGAARRQAQMRLRTGLEQRFEKYKATFLMIDRYPELATRFTEVTLT